MNIRDLIEASQDELITITTLGGSCLADPLVFYAKSRCLYLEADLEKLVQHIEDAAHKTEQEWTFFVGLSKIRLAIRSSTHGDDFQELMNLATGNEYWQIELYSILAQLYESTEELKAKVFYRKAYDLSHKNELKKRASVTYQNYIACLARLEPSSCFLPQYHLCYELAKEATNTGAQAMALTNIATEYRLIGAKDLALEYNSRAMSILSEHRLHSYDYYYTLTERISVLQSMGFNAQEEIDSLKNSKFKDLKVPVKNSRHYLESVELAPLENSLIDCLAKERRRKHEIISMLYGDTLNLEMLENRFKQLLFRLRQKIPELVIRIGEYYQLRPCLSYELGISP